MSELNNMKSSVACFRETEIRRDLKIAQRTHFEGGENIRSL